MTLGMYVHTHWGYNHPYAARTWSLQDWQGYLTGLRALGYDTVMFWPLVDAMPAQPTASDSAFLARSAQVIEMAHQQFGMRFIITACPNVMGNDLAAQYSCEERPYFICEHKVNPRDRAEVEAMLAARRWQFEPLRKADGLAIIDSDPGGYIGSTNAEFVDLLGAQTDLFRQFNPQAELYYWMWFGWESYNRFWAEAQKGREGDAAPSLSHDTPDVRVYLDTLPLVKQRIAEPWCILMAWPQHLEATRQLGMLDKRFYIPYGAIEGEPTFPLTNCTPAAVRAPFERYPGEPFPRGVMGNAQTHCLQLPHTYLLAHYAQGGTDATADLAGFAEGLLPGLGPKIAAAWEAIGVGTAQQQRAAAQTIRAELGQSHAMGQYAGLLFGNPQRFLSDLMMNLEVRAALADLHASIADNQPGAIKRAVQVVLEHLRPYQQRLGFVDAYGGPLIKLLNEPLASLHDAGLDKVLGQFHDWRNPAVRNGVMPRLLDAMQRYAEA